MLAGCGTGTGGKLASRCRASDRRAKGESYPATRLIIFSIILQFVALPVLAFAKNEEAKLRWLNV
jgi:hypothetical protein